MKPRLDHETPNWVRSDATFFITACTQQRGHNFFCHPEMGKVILDSIRWRNEKRSWFCELALLMPDHIHLIASFSDDVLMTKCLRDWKSWLAKNYEARWQENFFDHRLRSDEQFNQKAAYILQNPVRAGLVAGAEDWPYVWMSGG